jgi:predicted nucleic acid-binding protein
MRIYLDTSVPSTYFDARTPERQKATREFWKKANLEGHTLYVSEVVIAEISKTPSLEKRNQILALVDDLEHLALGPPVPELAEQIIASDLVPAGKIEDALHLALAALHLVDVVVSWNFRHMVNLKMKQKLPTVLAASGCFKRFEIITPFEYSEGE